MPQSSRVERPCCKMLVKYFNADRVGKVIPNTSYCTPKYVEISGKSAILIDSANE